MTGCNSPVINDRRYFPVIHTRLTRFLRVRRQSNPRPSGTQQFARRSVKFVCGRRC